mmetsp:Transcript_4690/g.12908  ORF Transcript_4690/g.12908 Transcript_4690/m.12908 type:complete len:209 (-) Transcript_4690:171-797(-)
MSRAVGGATGGKACGVYIGSSGLYGTNAVCRSLPRFDTCFSIVAMTPTGTVSGVCPPCCGSVTAGSVERITPEKPGNGSVGPGGLGMPGNVCKIPSTEVPGWPCGAGRTAAAAAAAAACCAPSCAPTCCNRDGAAAPPCASCCADPTAPVLTAGGGMVAAAGNSLAVAIIFTSSASRVVRIPRSAHRARSLRILPLSSPFGDMDCASW